MRIFTLFFLPIYLSSQQIGVELNWRGTEELYVGLQPVKIPKAVGQTIFYDEENHRFSISIKKNLGDNPNLQYYIKNVQTQIYVDCFYVFHTPNLTALRILSSIF